MDIAEDVTAALAQEAGGLAGLAGDFCDAAEGEGRLGIDPAAPKSQPAAGFVFPFLGRMSTGGPLNGVDDVEAGFDYKIEQVVDRAAAVQEPLELRCETAAFRVDALVIREEEPAEDLGRGDEVVLRAPVIGGEHENIDVGGDLGQQQAGVEEGVFGN